MKPFDRFVRPILLLAGCVLVGGCSILPQAEPSDIYRLPATQAPITPGTPVKWSLRLASPQASEVLNSPKIAVIPHGNLLSSYAASRWSDPAPVLLRNRLLDGFAQDGRVGLLSVADSNLQTDLELGGQLQAFQTEYQGAEASVVIRLDALLVRGFDQRILASRRFEVRQPLSDVQVPAVVQGFGQASDRLTAEVVNWTVEQGQRLALPAHP
ncbi:MULTISPECIES: ABC-type transport auxiliary lipoprotein family protein [unclassified Pseudomonas]|uniref:ABC-type transport auxiliary lipoprotein family protein n=1 Tax=unclassified Pseudomonas TaxID=196821 RepID=UPI0008ABF201|nr:MULTISPECIES: ABC-type transport auxiliary lipoprotein family protein [unclassified Pseudomonas]SEO66509.1 cholesterol transport system auxiliary component [Pseudomonas sp. NFACC39-1]SFH24729.1 cholesterol transport system auxiliary component [Pseudomonas sp. NFACC45]